MSYAKLLWLSQLAPSVKFFRAVKRRLLLGRKAVRNLDGVLKSRDAALPRKVRIVQAMVFPVVM